MLPMFATRPASKENPEVYSSFLTPSFFSPLFAPSPGQENKPSSLKKKSNSRLPALQVNSSKKDYQLLLSKSQSIKMFQQPISSIGRKNWHPTKSSLSPSSKRYAKPNLPLKFRSYSSLKKSTKRSSMLFFRK